MMVSGIEKQISKGIQIVAVLMMVFHHTFGFPERYLEGISYIGLTIGSIHVEQFIGSMCKICVSLFAFGTGYALAHKKLTLKYIWKKICLLMLIYWFSLIVFVIAKCIDGSGCSIIEITKNIFLYSFSINNNAWYEDVLKQYTNNCSAVRYEISETYYRKLMDIYRKGVLTDA